MLCYDAPAHILRSQRLHDGLKVFAISVGRGVDRFEQRKQAILGPGFRIEGPAHAHAFTAHDFHAEFDALVAYVNAAGPGREFFDFLLRLSAEGAMQLLRHETTCQV